MEKWLPVPGYEGHYEVSDSGRVRRVESVHGRPPGYVLKTQTNHDGYQTVALSVRSVQKSLRVHRLVALRRRGG